MHFNKGADSQLTDLPKAPKTARWGKSKNIAMTLFVINVTWGHLAMVTSKGVITKNDMTRYYLHGEETKYCLSLTT